MPADREVQTETVPADAALAAGAAQADAVQATGTDVLSGGGSPGLSWSWELDFETLLAALSESAPWNRPMPHAGSVSQTSVDTADAGTAGGGTAGGGTAEAAGAGAGAVAEADAPSPIDAGSVTTAVADAGVAGADVADSADADLAELLEAIEAGRTRQVPLAVVAGRVAESLPTGPDLAGWLATSSVGEMEDGALAGVAASWRRLASWAQAGELAAVARIASRSAARDPKIAVAADGRPERIPDEAAAQVSLGLVMSGYNASWWLDLAVTLAWRLAATGAALAAGVIDLPRARLIAEATSLLSEENARAVEDQILPAAPELTSAGLRAALRRAAGAADPGGAERRRKESEARAKICLYPDEEGTAALSGYSLPGIGAAAAMARISALARALKASGAGGGIDLLRAQVFLGLLCGTLPL